MTLLLLILASWLGLQGSEMVRLGDDLKEASKQIRQRDTETLTIVESSWNGSGYDVLFVNDETGEQKMVTNMYPRRFGD